MNEIFCKKRMKEEFSNKALITEKNTMPLVASHDLDTEKRT